MELILCLPEGAKMELQGNNIVLTIDTDITKTDLWKAQFPYCLEHDDKVIESGNLRIERNSQMKLVRGRNF